MLQHSWSSPGPSHPLASLFLLMETHRQTKRGDRPSLPSSVTRQFSFFLWRVGGAEGIQQQPRSRRRKQPQALALGSVNHSRIDLCQQ